MEKTRTVIRNVRVHADTNVLTPSGGEVKILAGAYLVEVPVDYPIGITATDMIRDERIKVDWQEQGPQRPR